MYFIFLHRQIAPKITGMLLELSRNEVIALIRDAAMLNSKVQEAMKLLESDNFGDSGKKGKNEDESK